jgi:methylglutaconyl-CoA hydratase
MPDYRKLAYRVDESVARLTLNRPEKRNALDAEMIGEIKDALDHAARAETVRVILLTGAGMDFCSGMDLTALAAADGGKVLDHLAEARDLGDLFLAMRRHPLPIVAAVRGRALAGGCGLATAADVILAAESAQFGYPEVRIGFIPAMVMAILRRSVCEKHAFELIATGEVVGARAALDMGLINRVFADATFESAVEAYARNLASHPAAAISLAKSLLYQMDGMSFPAAIEAGAQMNAIVRQTGEFKSGVANFLKKKP